MPGRLIAPAAAAVALVAAALLLLGGAPAAPVLVSHADVLRALDDSGVLMGAGAKPAGSWRASWFVYGRRSQPHSFQGLLVQVTEMPSISAAAAIARHRRPLQASAAFEDYVITVDGSPVSNARAELSRVLHALGSRAA